MTKVDEYRPLDGESFRLLAELMYRESGLCLSADKTTMIQSRLRKRLRAVDLSDFGSYVRFVGSDQGTAERRYLISALTTNVSSFFREEHHFSALLKQVVQPCLAKVKSGGSFRIWSAGCSNGQEAYSAAISLLEFEPKLENLDLRILGTDIDSDVVRFASQGHYPERMIGGLSKERLSSFFQTQNDRIETIYTVRAPIRKLVNFKELNLHARWPMKKRFDAIFCRNVVIYFDKQRQESLWPRFFDQLKDDGRLFLGHSERIANPERYGFESVGPTTYQKRRSA